MVCRIGLDGTWSFVHRADEHAEPTAMRSIVVPGPWQAQFADLRMKVGRGTYRRQIDLTQPLTGDHHVYLHFGAVFHHASVSVNGRRVGGHDGGFLPFSFDVTAYLHDGVNAVEVEALTPSDDVALYPDAPFAEIQFGKQSWYGPLSGLWQSVWLEWRCPDHVERIHVRSAGLAGVIEAELSFRSPLSRDSVVEVEILDDDARTVSHLTCAAARDVQTVPVHLEVDGALPWSPDSPTLYQIRATLLQEARQVDRHAEHFGFRTIEARDGAFFLNGRRLYLRGALDQDYYPDTICTTPSTAFLEDQFRKAKALGLNCLRLHIKVPDPRYYEVADRIGLLIWTELPNGGLSTERSRKRKERLLKGIVDRDGNHPCIVIWTIINENWGIDLVHDPDHRVWLKQTYAWLKGYDPGRLVVDNSPLSPSFHIESDIADHHFYAAIPDHREAWDAFVAKLAGGLAWLFSPEGDAVIKGDEPRLCSEFGNWGLPDPAAIRGADGHEPWWFESGHDWGDGVMYPHGIEQRFDDWSLGRVFGSLKDFVVAVQWQQFRALKYEIETMRRRPELAGYVITEFTDVHWESNGLLDLRRNERVFHDRFRSINADTIVVPTADRLSYWSGEQASIGLAVAHHGAGSIAGATLVVTSGQERNLIAVPPFACGDVVDLKPANVGAACLGSASGQHIDVALFDGDGALLARNGVDLAVHERPDGGLRAEVEVWSSDDGILAHLSALGYRSVSTPDGAAIVIATGLDEHMASFVRRGGKVLLLPEAECDLQPFFPHWQNVRVVKRMGSLWQGDWASSFSWLRRTGRFAGFPGGPLLDGSFDRVLPAFVITGCNLLDFHARVHAGMVVGWIHRPAVLVVERSYGKGCLLASTLRPFRNAPGFDPTATKLIDALLRTLTKR